MQQLFVKKVFQKLIICLEIPKSFYSFSMCCQTGRAGQVELLPLQTAVAAGSTSL